MRRKTFLLGVALFATGLPAAGSAQVSFTGGPSPDDDLTVVCYVNGRVLVVKDEGDCSFTFSGFDPYPSSGPSALLIGPSTATGTSFADDGTATFNRVTTFNGNTVFNGNASFRGITNNGGITTGTLATGGAATIGGDLSVTGVSRLDIAEINGLGFRVAFGDSLVTNKVSIGAELSFLQGAQVDLAGNRITNVGAPVDTNDAATRGYVDASIGEVTAQSAVQGSRIAVLENSTTNLTGRMDMVEGVAASQGAAIASLQQDSAGQGSSIALLQQDSTALGGRLSDAEAMNLAQAGQIDGLQAGQAALFDLAKLARRDIGRANEGVAMALAMDSPGLPEGTSFALSGGIGHYAGRSAGTIAFTARTSDRSSVSAGLGVGFDSGKVGARAGFQIAW